METSEFESIRELVAQAMSVLGAPSKADAGYFRLQRNIDGSTRTTLAVYGDGIGSNLIEVAFNVQAIASCLAIGTVDAEAWVSARRLRTGHEVHENPHWKYARIGIKERAELFELLEEWEVLVRSTSNSSGRSKGLTGLCRTDTLSVPFYIEPSGSKTHFLPSLRRTQGYRVGAKGKERYFSDYWEALYFLKQLHAPASRRPNASKIPGIVRCQPGDTDNFEVAYLHQEVNRNARMTE